MFENEKSGVSRRALLRTAAWTVPVAAVAVSAPSATASLLPCTGEIAAVGGTYPVATSLSGCGGSGTSTHWDFNIQIQAAAQSGTDCDCDKYRVTFFDNPKRSRLWISGGSLNPSPDWTGSSADAPRLYVQKELSPGQSAKFPSQGDVVRRVGGSSPWNGYATGGSTVGTIDSPGSANDALHVLMNPDGTLPSCSGQGGAPTGPMAFYTLECQKGGTYTPLGGVGTISICAPMISATVCRASSSGNGSYKLGISVLNACGKNASQFKITKISRNNSDTQPTGGTDVWTGSQALGAGATNITTSTSGSGSYLWISFTTDNGANTSMIRVSTTNSGC